MNRVGPLEFMVIAFSGVEPSDRAAHALRAVEVSGDVRIVDALVVVRDAGGRVRAEELRDVPALAEVAAEYGLTQVPLSLIDTEDVAEVGALLGRLGHAIVLLVEHVWARETAEVVSAAGGRLLASVRVPDAHAAEATALLAA